MKTLRLLALALLGFVSIPRALATLSVNTIWEINNGSGVTSANGAGGGFNPSNANMPTDLATTGATGQSATVTVSSATYTFGAGDANQWLYVKSGTSWTPGWYKITSVSAGVATVNGTIGTAVQTDATVGFPAPRYKASTVQGIGTATNLTGGTFTVDYSQNPTVPSSAPNNSATDIVLATTTTCTSATILFTAAHVGNIIHITAGTGFTQGWYEIVSVTANTATLDRAAGTGGSTGGTGIVGGTISLNSATTSQTDDDFFEQSTGTNGTGGARIFWKGTGTTYTNNTAISLTAAGGSKAPVVVEGYTSIRGDTPTRSGATDNRPVFDLGTNSIVWGAYWQYYNLSFKTTTSGAGVQLGAGNVAQNCKAVNSSTNADKACWTAGANSLLINCEGISYRGRAVYSNGQDGFEIIGCWLHDSKWGLLDDGGSTQWSITYSLIEGNVSGGIQLNTSKQGKVRVLNNTFAGHTTPLGVGIDLITGVDTRGPFIFNNVFTGFVTALQAADVSTGYYNDYNDFYNNTNDVNDTTKIQKGKNSSAVNPSFTSVGEATGSTATTTAGNHLVQTGAFTNVVAGRDYVYVASGTGPTAGVYGILSVDSADQITTDLTLTANATANKVFYITTGHNFALGTAMKALGFPGLFQGGYTTGYTDQGAAQRQESGSSGTVGF